MLHLFQQSILVEERCKIPSVHDQQQQHKQELPSAILVRCLLQKTLRLYTTRRHSNTHSQRTIPFSFMFGHATKRGTEQNPRQSGESQQAQAPWPSTSTGRRS